MPFLFILYSEQAINSGKTGTRGADVADVRNRALSLRVAPDLAWLLRMADGFPLAAHQTKARLRKGHHLGLLFLLLQYLESGCQIVNACDVEPRDCITCIHARGSMNGCQLSVGV